MNSEPPFEPCPMPPTEDGVTKAVWLADFFQTLSKLQPSLEYDQVMEVAHLAYARYSAIRPQYVAEIALYAQAGSPDAAGDLPPFACAESEKIEEAVSRCFLGLRVAATYLPAGLKTEAIVQCYRERYPMLSFQLTSSKKPGELALRVNLQA